MTHQSNPSSSPVSSSSRRLIPLLGASLALNLGFLVAWLYAPPSSSSTPLTWTRLASLEAELAASFSCSGHGFVYAEMLRSSSSGDGVACECDECFSGPSCEHAIPDCKPDVDGGDPLVFYPFWRQNAEASAVLIPGWYRMGYEFFKPLVPALEQEIRSLHAMVGNAVTEGKYIVVGNGATQLLMAAFSGFSADAQGPVSVVVPAPYYDAYKRQIMTAKPGKAQWAEPFILEESNEMPIEIVTSPNNPDGSLRSSVLSGTNSYTFYDHAYYWPHYTPITGPLDHDIMFFTLSKVAGHAGSRIGWAIIKDFAVYEKLLLFVRLNSVGVAHESQLRASHLIRTIREGYAKSGKPALNKSPDEYAAHQTLFHYGHAKLRSRWDRMLEVLAKSDQFKVEQDFEPKYCNFFEDTVRPAPAFAWIRCAREEDQQCTSLFEGAGIFGRGGLRCGVNDRYMRLAMMSTDSSFENLIARVETLVSNQ